MRRSCCPPVRSGNFQVFVDQILQGNALNADTDVAALELHATMSGKLAFGQVSPFGSISALVTFIYPTVGNVVGNAIVVPDGWRGMAPKGYGKNI